MQYHAIPCNTMQYHAIPCNSMQFPAIPCISIQNHAIPCNTMQYHACLITVDGAYHCPVGWVQKHNIWNPNAKLLNAKSWSPKKEILSFCRCFFFIFAVFCICRVLFADGDWEVEFARRREGLRWCGGGADVLHPARTACHCCRPHPCCVSFQSHFSFRLWPSFGFCFFSRFWLWYLKMYYCPNFHVQAFSSPLHPLRSISSEETGLQKTETEKFTEI